MCDEVMRESREVVALWGLLSWWASCHLPDHRQQAESLAQTEYKSINDNVKESQQDHSITCEGEAKVIADGRELHAPKQKWA